MSLLLRRIEDCRRITLLCYVATIVIVAFLAFVFYESGSVVH